MLRKRIAVALVFIMIMLPFAGIAQAGLADKIDTTVQRLAKLTTTEVAQLIQLFEDKADVGYEAMFTASEKTNLTSKGVTAAALKAALADFRTQYVTAFPSQITTSTSDILKLADILLDIRSSHFVAFRNAASTDGKLQLDIFLEILLEMASLNLTDLSIPQSVSDNWFDILKDNATDDAAAIAFLSDHGVRLSKVNNFFEALNATDRAEMERILKKAGIISSSSGGGGGGGPIPPTTPTEIVIEPIVPAPGVSTAVAAQIPVSVLQESFGKQQPVALDFGDLVITLPPGFLADSALSGATSISLEVAEIADYPVPAGMATAGKVFEFSLLVNKDGQQTRVTSFAVPLQISIPVDDLNLSVAEMEKLGLYRLSGNQWTYIGGTINTQTKELNVTLGGFSQYRIMAYNKTFTDVPSTHWARRTIELLTARHLVAGMTETTFAPEVSLTRAQTATLLVRALNLKDNGTNVSYSDVKQGDWYYGTVRIAAQAGLVAGYTDGTFKPNQIVSRQEFALMVVRAARAAGQDVTLTSEEVNQIFEAYGDSGSVSTWARADMGAAIKMGIIGGFPDNTIKPAGVSTRAQGAAMLERLLRKLGKI